MLGLSSALQIEGRQQPSEFVIAHDHMVKRKFAISEADLVQEFAAHVGR